MIKKIFLLTISLLTSTYMSFAQIVSGDMFIKEVEDKVSNVVPTILRILSIAVILAGGVWLGVISFSSNNKNSQQKNELITWFATIGTILIALEILIALAN